jgi:quercetin dioxygenase-like cupin family protein
MKVKRRRAPSTRAIAPLDSLVRVADLPWFPFISEGIHVKLCRVSLGTGEMVLLIRAAPGASLATHYHHGGFVAYTIAGQWRYRGEERTVGPGDVVVEPAGAEHGFEAVGPGPAETFVHLSGAIEFRDEDGRTLGIESAETLHGRYIAHCALHGLLPVDVTGRPGR